MEYVSNWHSNCRTQLHHIPERHGRYCGAIPLCHRKLQSISAPEGQCKNKKEKFDQWNFVNHDPGSNRKRVETGILQIVVLAPSIDLLPVGSVFAFTGVEDSFPHVYRHSALVCHYLWDNQQPALLSPSDWPSLSRAQDYGGCSWQRSRLPLFQTRVCLLPHNQDSPGTLWHRNQPRTSHNNNNYLVLHCKSTIQPGEKEDRGGTGELPIFSWAGYLDFCRDRDRRVRYTQVNVKV